MATRVPSRPVPAAIELPAAIERPATIEVTQVLAEPDWLERRSQHERRVDTLLAGHQQRAARGEAHPVEDFLFTYYSLRPSQLRRWHPGAGVALAGPAARERLDWRDHLNVNDAVALDVAAYLARRGVAVRFMAGLLRATAGRPAQLGCFGLHEWAMVYRQDAEQVRHARWPLRLGRAGTDAVVESERIRCTHHDAFRFFTEPARPRNQLQPTRADQLSLEQPGCLHATMDLYKISYKLGPLVPGELLLDAFELAREVRQVDMRASPYDLSALGYPPIRIETPAGKAEYVASQRSFAERGGEHRGRLIDLLKTVIES
jgi:hypothetical protein